MANNTTQKQAAKQFVQDWSGKGYEEGDTARFWIALLQNVYGIQDATKFMEFESPVKTIFKEQGSDLINGYIPYIMVLIEQKDSTVERETKHRRDVAVANGKCPRCGGNQVLREGKYSQFYGFSNNPKCNYILMK